MGGTQPGLTGGVPQPGPMGEYLTSGTLLSDLAGGTPPWIPPVRPGQGVPHLRYRPPIRPGWEGTPLRYPPSDLTGGYPHPIRPGWGGGTPAGRGVPHLIQDNRWSTCTPRSVCLLRSHRRPFLFIISDYRSKSKSLAINGKCVPESAEVHRSTPSAIMYF